jgi:hypothetical protein
MTDAFEIRRVSPTYPPKSSCGVPPQAVREVSRLPSSALSISASQRFRIPAFTQPLSASSVKRLK